MELVRKSCELILGAAIFSLHELDFHLLGAQQSVNFKLVFLIHELLVGRFRTQPSSWLRVRGFHSHEEGVF